MRKLYIAAPLFSAAEQSFNKNLKHLLAPYFSVYLPQEDGELLVEVIARGGDVDRTVTSIFHADLQAIREADVVLLVLDGRAPDEGACFELGFAYSLGKTCVGLQTDPRRLLPLGNNPMLAGALRQTFSTLEELVEWASGRS